MERDNNDMLVWKGGTVYLAKTLVVLGGGTVRNPIYRISI